MCGQNLRVVNKLMRLGHAYYPNLALVHHTATSIRVLALQVEKKNAEFTYVDGQDVGAMSFRGSFVLRRGVVCVNFLVHQAFI